MMLLTKFDTNFGIIILNYDVKFAQDIMQICPKNHQKSIENYCILHIGAIKSINV